MNKAMKTFLVICVAIMIGSFTGVSALWEYAANIVNPTSVQHFLGMEEFYYAENVPDDEEENLSHNNLLVKIVDVTDGLNNPNSLLSKALKERFEEYDNVSSNQQVSGGNLRNKFAEVDGYEYVGFLIVYKSDDHYEIYTYDNRDAVKLNISVPTYLTNVYLRDGKWVLSGGYEGTAVSVVYDGKTNGPYKNTINPGSFLKK